LQNLLYHAFMDRIAVVVCLVLVCGNAQGGGPSYRCTSLGQIPNDGLGGTVDSFTRENRITLDAGRYKHLFVNGNFVDLHAYWPDTGSFTYTNDNGQFLETDQALYARYRSGITNAGTMLEPQLEFSNQIYARGMNEQYIFGGEKDTTDERYTAGYYYEMATGQYHYVENPFEENQRTDVMAMNNNGYMVVNRGSLMPRTDPGFHIFTWIYKDFVKQTMVGQADFSFINSKGQLLGQDIWDYQTTLFFDGIKSELFSNYYEGKYWWAAGLDDAGTMLMHDRKPSSLRSTALRKDGVWYSWHEACPTLSPNMTIRNAYMREDGAVAAIGVENGKGYLLRFDPVPEPGSLVALGSGLALLLRRRRGR